MLKTKCVYTLTYVNIFVFIRYQKVFVVANYRILWTTSVGTGDMTEHKGCREKGKYAYTSNDIPNIMARAIFNI